MSIEMAKAFVKKHGIEPTTEAERSDDERAAILCHAYATAQNRELQEKLHKADGMANEINILTRANRELQERVEELEGTTDQLREQNRLVVSPADEANLIECVVHEIETQLRDDPSDRISKAVVSTIREWFQVFGEDQTTGLPEYENHRY